MMMKRRADQGSALLIALVVVILAGGIGGAFVAESLFHANAQKTTTDQDELMVMCDAGMERAKQAMDLYRNYTPQGWTAPAGYTEPVQLPPPAPITMRWEWSDIIKYSWDSAQHDVPATYWTQMIQPTFPWWQPL